MIYIFALLFPPVVVFIKGTFKEFLLNLILSLFFYAPGLVHCIIIIEREKYSKVIDNLENQKKKNLAP
jgi:uncharacterized membrane protein YqaE (UPF0057 family)